MIEHLCGCGASFRRYNTLQRKCGKCYLNDNPTKPRKRINRIGPVTRKLIEQRNQWIIDNQPDDNGNYICYYCDKPVHIDAFQLEHKKTKNNHPELRFVKSNLVPSCPFDNKRKGGTDDDQYIKLYYPEKA